MLCSSFFPLYRSPNCTLLGCILLLYHQMDIAHTSGKKYNAAVVMCNGEEKSFLLRVNDWNHTTQKHPLKEATNYRVVQTTNEYSRRKSGETNNSSFNIISVTRRSNMEKTNKLSKYTRKKCTQVCCDCLWSTSNRFGYLILQHS